MYPAWTAAAAGHPEQESGVLRFAIAAGAAEAGIVGAVEPEVLSEFEVGECELAT